MSERYLLDTNVVSELARPRPDERVVAFVGSLDETIVSAVTVYEMEHGIRRMPPGRRREALDRWLAAWLSPPVRIAPLDADAARAAARIEEAARRSGRTVTSHDLFVLATAASAGLTVATRNVSDFRGHGVPVHDPFGDER